MGLSERYDAVFNVDLKLDVVILHKTGVQHKPQTDWLTTIREEQVKNIN